MKIKQKALLALGGALIGGALFISINPANGYDQQNTHPALTDEAVDFYNLSFPGNRLTEDDKKRLTKGAVDEDAAPRPLNHFYDPIYNQGWIGYTPSKIWAYSSEKQVVFFGGKSQTAGFAQFFIGNKLSADDYSYQRALYDYAVGDRKRAMLAMGHIMHLLEDANVPDHTRNDTHLPWASTESPYEKTMARWNPGNLDIAGKIFASGTKPILVNGLGDYFDKIAKYSNEYFFSEDTILSTKYILPRKISERPITEEGENYRFAMGRDRNGELYPLFRMDPISRWRNFSTPTEFTIDSPIVLDTYWSRLSKDFVPLGAGVLKLFLEQAELVKREYAKNQQATLTPSPIGGILGLLGVSGSSEPQPAFDPTLIDSILGGSRTATDDVGVPPTPSATPLTSLTPSPTPSVTSSPSPTPLSYGGGNSQNTASSTSPTPTLLPSPTLSPTSLPFPTPSPTLTPSATPTPTPLPTPTPKPTQSGTAVIINEIAWMGTATSSNDEWLELYNPSSVSVDVSGWRLRSLTDNSPDITIATASIDSYGFFLLERTDDTTISDILADQIYTGALSNNGEVLELRDKNGSFQDLVSKSADGKWYAGENDGKYTMERINPAKAGNDLTNWATNNGIIRNGLDAGGNSINGTPGAQNSVYLAEDTMPTPSPSSTPTPTPTPGIVWQSEVPAAYYINQPAIDPDGTVYFGAPNDATGAPRLYAVGSDGIEKWHHDNEIAGFGVPTTPAVSADGAIYFGHLSSWVTALNPDGTLRWQYDTGRVNGVGVDEEGGVYFTSDNKMITKIGPDGVKQWQAIDPNTFSSIPVTIPGDKDVYLGFDENQLPGFYRLKGDDGTVVWHSRPSDNYQYWAPDPVFDEATGKFYTATTAGHIISVSRSDGKIDSKLFAFGVPATTKVAIFEDILVFGVDFSLQNLASGQAVIALNKTDGSKIWTFPVDSRVNGQIAVGATGNLYFATRNGRVYSLDKDGQERWILDLGVSTELYPVLGENAVFIGIGGAGGGKLVKIADN